MVEPAVKRPSSVSKSRKSSSLRMSFGPADLTDGKEGAFTPKKSSLSRVAIEGNAERQAALQENAGPSYSKDHLAELRSATPSRPAKHNSGTDEAANEIDTVERGTRELDIASKFGSTVAARTEGRSAIPSETEIREKKERRARLAKEQAADFISLDANGDEDEDNEFKERRLLLRPEEKYPERRLVQEDEDVAEGFDEFTQDGKLALGRRAERKQESERKKDMEEMIARAEGSDEGDSDASEADRSAAYEAAQTRAGTYGARRTGMQAANEDGQRHVPLRIAPVPELSAVLAKLRGTLAEMNAAQRANEMKLERLQAEKEELAERERWIQTQLAETGQRYEKLRQEAGTGATNGAVSTSAEGRMFLDRGLDSLGTLDTAGGPALSDPGGQVEV